MTQPYEFNDDMNEISGMDGNYEACCRRMLKGGMEYINKNPDLDPKYHGYENVTGIISEDNDDAALLSKAITDAAGEYEPSGAMLEAVVKHCLWIRANGWDAYVKKKTHPQGQVGILKDKLTQAWQDNGRLRQRFDELERENGLRGIIIAEEIFGWKAWPVSCNSEQRVYAPNAYAALNMTLGSRMSEFVDGLVKKMHEDRARKKKFG